MERGVYFDAWFPRQHNYHPSLPPRRLRMIDHLEDFHATVLVWAALGGGSISLPYLEEEAYGEIDPRFRFYGFVNDVEFIKAAQDRGIKVFSIIFEAGGWEFPVELNEDESQILAMNELRGVGKRDWLGLREFSQNRYPKLWKPFEHYFPGGLVNSDGEQVTDMIEECCSRDIYGVPCHSHWVEVPDNDHECYTMDRNNPVWREYLKAIIRIQIDAGVAGVQLDEAELPLTSLQYGGCFCKDCMKEFRAYLQALPEDERPSELDGVDLATFHYGEWLLSQGYDFKTRRSETPLYWHYIRCQRDAITRYFAELADYAREYATSQGREVLVSGNFFNLLDQYYSLEPKVDMVVTEMRNTRYRQPEWYRYVHGFAGDKPVVVVENPYGGVVPELVDKLGKGKGYDLFRMSLYEGAANGVNMSVPYGSWMGSVQEDAFYAPHELAVEIQDFLAANEALFSRKTASQTAVVYSVESNAYGESKPDEAANNTLNLMVEETLPFWHACDALSTAVEPYDVVMFPDGTLRTDHLTPDDLAQYRTLVLPGCHFLTDTQVGLIRAHLERGGVVITDAELGANLPDETRRPLLEHAGTRVINRNAYRTAVLEGERQVRLDGTPNLSVTLQRVDEGIAVHILRYDYDEEADAVPPLDELVVSVRLPEQYDEVTTFDQGGRLSAPLSREGETHTLSLRDVPLYSIVLLHTTPNP
jgi:hypothetical protein